MTAGRGTGAERTVRMIGGPLDGEELPAEDISEGEASEGAYMVVEGWEQRAEYLPADGGDPLVWHYCGPVNV